MINVHDVLPETVDDYMAEFEADQTARHGEVSERLMTRERRYIEARARANERRKAATGE